MDKLVARGRAASPGFSEGLKPGLQQPAQLPFTAQPFFYHRRNRGHSRCLSVRFLSVSSCIRTRVSLVRVDLFLKILLSGPTAITAWRVSGQ